MNKMSLEAISHGGLNEYIIITAFPLMHASCCVFNRFLRQAACFQHTMLAHLHSCSLHNSLRSFVVKWQAVLNNYCRTRRIACLKACFTAVFLITCSSGALLILLTHIGQRSTEWLSPWRSFRRICEYRSAPHQAAGMKLKSL